MHYQNCHNKNLSNQTLYNNTTIIQKELNNQKLIMKESLEIIEKKSSLNVREEKFSYTVYSNYIKMVTAMHDKLFNFSDTVLCIIYI